MVVIAFVALRQTSNILPHRSSSSSRVTAACTATICGFLVARCFFFSSQNFRLVSAGLEGSEMARVVVADGTLTPWSMSRCASRLALLKIVGFDDRTFP